MAELLLTTRAKNDLKVLPQPIREAVLDTLTRLEGDPEGLGKEMRGRLRGLWSCRVGNYRILYTIEAGAKRTTVIVRAIRHRAAAYRARRAQSRRRR